MRKTRTLVVAAGIVAALAIPAAANAATATQTVAGTTLSTLALAATPVALNTQFSPGQTASNSVPGAITVSSTGAWNLTAQDSTNGGHLASTAGLTCNPASGPQSAATTANQLNVSIAGTLPGITTGAGTVQIGSSPSAVASGTLADSLLANYTLALGATEQLLTGCVYSTTVTYTAS
jgi:hypothetical protein